MVDQYDSMSELMKQTTENRDWKIITRHRSSHVLVTAVHGGAIERGTTELASLTATKGSYDYYTFKAIRKNHNQMLHVTSRHYDEPQLLKMVKDKTVIISLHGCKGTKETVYIGGKDLGLREILQKELEKNNFRVKEAPEYIDGMDDDNFVNCGETNKGVQLELTEPLRKSFFKNKKYDLHNRENQDNWSARLYDFADSIISSINKYEQ
ncbi:poly-gamma-glutamate hydrolase family protein [Staphylococcus sp. SQ8-PEA]|uniref:Poly-gamma-glutamate hydrolase family protein n=1 Tax=Staphylococcus marylandisciuri TaxID=2981529 RepID=A0ABT2QS04_9STAP|nr:poly-gamma-glutamate hydrolase family protein [Staphylococcus marylandisciuri]MCU5746771.1 poly-gamma-glutamate hydrolase family protein [Staphylococcus marylandisciuri]